jgi:hypothetical protein
MNTMQQEVPHPAPWYRQFWPWYLIGLLLLGVTGTSVLIVSAIEHPDALVVDNYYKEGLAINRTLDRQRRAAAMGIVADIRYDSGSAILSIHLTAKQAIRAASLSLHFVHATLANRDYRVTLQRTSADNFQARLASLRAGNYDVLLEPDNRTWRVDAHLELPAKSWSMKAEY